MTTPRFYIVHVEHGLLRTSDDQTHAEQLALVASVNSGRTVHLHDRLTELNGPRVAA